jgi:hypothetical protein
MLSPMVLGGLSAALVIAGVIVVVRDYRKPKRLLQPHRAQQLANRPAAGHIIDPPTEALDTEVTIVHRPAETESDRSNVTAAPKIRPGKATHFDQLRSSVSTISNETAADADAGEPEGQRWPSVESRWLTLEPALDMAVAQLNAALSDVDLQIGKPGEPGWSFKNRGFGSYRRIAIAGRSVAWLRGEANQAGVVTFRIRAHTVEQALLNATSTLQTGDFGPLPLLDAVSSAIKPSAEYAAWLAPHRQAERDAVGDAWSEISTVAADALQIAQGALIEAGAELTETSAPVWDPASGHQRWPLGLRVAGRNVATLNIELIKRGLEVSSSASVAARTDLTRRRRLELKGLTPHMLAEALAACAWPAIEEALQHTQAETTAAVV